QLPPQLIGHLQRRHQRFGGHLATRLGQGDRQPHRLLIVQDLVDFGLRLLLPAIGPLAGRCCPGGDWAG
ncbi:MAG: hypothetical protein ACK535_17395, partial [Cyanobacteriota bacterium]